MNTKDIKIGGWYEVRPSAFYIDTYPAQVLVKKDNTFIPTYVVQFYTSQWKNSEVLPTMIMCPCPDPSWIRRFKKWLTKTNK